MSLRVTGSQVIFPDQSELKTAPMGFGFKNRIINGDMRIAQRGTSIAAPNGVASYGGPDRFLIYQDNSAGVTQSQSTLLYNSVTKQTCRQTVTTGTTSFPTGSHWTGIQQNIEGYNAYDLIGQPISVSFIFNTNVTGTYSVSVRNGSSTQSYVTTINATANTPTKYTISIPANAALGVPNSNATGLVLNIGALNQGVYQTPTLNSWQSSNFISAAGATIWAAAAGNFIEVTEVQLEKGATATDFDYRPYSVELSLCFRYYNRILYNSGSGPIFITYTANGDTRGVINFGSEMRAPPTITSSQSTLTIIGVGNVGAPVNTTIVVNNWAAGATTKSTGINLGNTSGLTDSQCVWGTNTPFTLYLNAEL